MPLRYRRSRPTRRFTTASPARASNQVEPLERRTLLSAIAPDGGEFRLNTRSDRAQETPDLASDADGDFVAVWQDRAVDGTWTVVGQRFDSAGNKAGDEFIANTYQTNDQHGQRVAMDAAGDFVITWQSYLQDGSGSGVYGQRYNAAGVPQGPEFRANTTTAGHQGAPDVAMAPDGNFVVVWQYLAGVYGQRYTADGLAAGGEFRVDQPVVGDVQSPKVSVADDGTFVVAWDHYQSNKVYAQRFGADGAKRGSPFVALDAANHQVEIGHDAAGNFLVGGGNGKARRFGPSGDPLGDPIAVGEATRGDWDVWDLAVGPAGDFVATSYSGTTVTYRRYSAAGVPLGAALRANSDTNFQKASPAVTMSDDGKIVVAWTSLLQDAQSPGVYAQRITPVADPMTVGDRAFADVDRDGAQDAGEAGVDGLPVRLFTAAGLPVAATVTANGGLYRFDNLRPGQQYYLESTADFGGAWSPPDQGGSDALDSDLIPVAGNPALARSAVFTAAAGQSDLSLDLGYVQPAVFEGLAWDDTDADGVRDDSEPARANVDVRVVNADGVVVAGGRTGADGRYRVTGVVPGAAYRVRFLTPQRWALTAQDRGGDDAADSDADPATGLTPAYTPAPGEVFRGWDAGLVPLAYVRGALFRDADGDGTRDPDEPALGGWTVFADADADGTADLGEPSALTNATGNYEIEVAGGTHRVTVAAPAGYAPPSPRTVTIAAGATVSSIDFILVPAAPVRHVTPVGGESLLNVTTDGSQTQPSVAADAAGNVVAAWFEAPASGTADPGRIVGRRFDAAGNALGGEFTVSDPSSPPSSSAGSPRVAAEADGDFVVAWQGSSAVYARRFAAAGTPLGNAFSPAQTAGGSKQNVRVAVDPTGGFALAWSGQTAGDDSGVAARRYDAAGNPRGDEFRVNESSQTTGSQFPGNLAFDSSGRLTVFYTNGTTGGLFARRYAADAAGAPLGPAVRVDNPAVAGTKTAADVAVNAAGRTMFLWGSSDGVVYGRAYDAAGTAVGGEFRVGPSSAAAGAAAAVDGPPRLAAGTDGFFLAAWQPRSAGTSPGNVYAQLLSADGVPHGREFRLNSADGPGGRSWPSLAAGPDGTYLAAWASREQDGSLDGVYAQRLATFTGTSSVTGLAWDDTNGDGVRGPGESHVNATAVSLLNEAGALVETTLTGAGGRYAFSVLRPGATYRVRFHPAYNRVHSPADRGADDTRDSDAGPTGLTAPFAAPAAGASAAGPDGGYAPAATITGAVFHDLDLDGVRDGTGAAAEPGQREWTVFLDTDADGRLDAGERATQTVADGAYSFDLLTAGTYAVGVVPILRWDQSTPAASLRVTVAAGQTARADVGVRPTAPTDQRAAPVGPERRVNTTTDGDQSWATVASNAAGQHVVVYVDRGVVTAQRFDAAGQAVGGEIAIGPSIQRRPSVAMAADGRFVVAWAQQDADIYARRFAASGAPAGAAWRVNTTTAGEQWASAVGVEADGDFVVAWQSGGAQDGAGEGVFAQRYAADGTPRGGEFVASRTTAGNQTDPQVGFDAAGGFVVAYTSVANLSNPTVRILAQRFTPDGQPTGPEADTGVLRTGAYFPPFDLAVNAAGEFVLAWEDGSGVTLRRYDAAGVPQGSSFLAEGFVPHRQYSPAIALADDGRFVVTWTDNAESLGLQPFGARGQLFNASGVRLGPEFRVNTTTTGNQVNPVPAFVPGGFVVAWTSYPDQDGWGSGVYAQRFETFAPAPVIGGVVFDDADADGLREAGEAGRDGIAVELVNEWGATVATTVTAGGGLYRFDTVRPGAAHWVRFVPPGATGFSPAGAGTDESADSDVTEAGPAGGLTAPVALAAGAVNTAVDAGLVALGRISGKTFTDHDADGVRDPGDTVLDGWTVFLDANDNGQLDPGERTAVSNADGVYVFDDVYPGGLRVEVLPQLRWDSTSPITARRVALAPGEARVLDLGAFPTGTAPAVTPAAAEMVADAPDEWENSYNTEPAGNTYDWFAADAAGNYVVTGHDYASGFHGLVGRRYAASGASAGPTFRVAADPSGTHRTPAVAMAPDGRFVVAWQNAPAGDLMTDVYVRRFNADGTPLGGDILVNTTTAGRQANPSVAIEPDGDFVVAWEQDPSPGDNRPERNNNDVLARRFAADGTARGGEFRVHAATPGNQFGPDVAVNAAGTVAVVWHDGGRVVARRYDAAGGPLGDETEVAPSHNGSPVESAAVAINAAGETAVVWHGPGVGGWQAQLVRYDAAGARQGAAERVGRAGGSRYPSVGLRDDGSVAVAWQQPEGTAPSSEGDRVYVVQFTGSGVQVGEPVRVSPATESRQRQPILALNAGGGFLVSWLTPAGGRARRYDARPTTAQSTVGGVVWTDANHNGVYDASTEAPAAGVWVDLLSVDGTHSYVAQSGADGRYRLSGVVPQTPYTLRFHLPAGKVPTLQNAGANDALDSDADRYAGTVPVTSPPDGQSDLTVGLGLTVPGALAGTRFHDRDADGARDAGEEGLPGWVIYVDADDDGALDAAEPRTATLPDGSFTLTNLAPGVHRVRAEAQDHWTDTTPAASLNVNLPGGGEAVYDVAVGASTDVPVVPHTPAGPAVRVSGTSGYFDYSDVAVNAAGDAVVVWAVGERTARDVYARLYDASGNPRGAGVVVTNAPGDQHLPSVAIDGDGNFVVVWQDTTDAAAPVIGVRRFARDGTPAGAAFRMDAVASENKHPDVAMDAAGNFAASWRRGSHAIVRRFDAGTGTLGDEVELGIPRQIEIWDNTAIAMNAAGQFVVAADVTVFGKEIYIQRFDSSGRKVGGFVRASPSVPGDQVFPDVAIDPAGNFAVGWMSRENGYQTVLRRFNAAGVPQGPGVTLGESTGFAGPSLAMAGDGSVVASWSFFNGYENDVLMQRVNAAGLPQGSIFYPGANDAVETHTNVAVDGQGNFWVVWERAAQGGGDLLVRRFTVGSGDIVAPQGRIENPPAQTAPVGSLSLTFSEPVTGLQASDLKLTRNSTEVSLAGATLSTADNVHFTLGNFGPANQTPGSYNIALGRLVSGVSDLAGNTLAADATAAWQVTDQSAAPPTVAAVYVDGTAWTAGFRQSLQIQGLGSSVLGFAVAAGAEQHNELPWANLNRVSIRFSKAVSVQQADLTVTNSLGAALGFATTGTPFVYDAATFTATWTLARSFSNEKITLRLDGDAGTGGVTDTDAVADLLDGEWTNPAGSPPAGGDTFPSGNGTAGGDFVFSLRSLPADFNRDGAVNLSDFGVLRANFGTGGFVRSVLQGDATGDGNANLADFGILRGSFGRTTPA